MSLTPVSLDIQDFLNHKLNMQTRQQFQGSSGTSGKVVKNEWFEEETGYLQGCWNAKLVAHIIDLFLNHVQTQKRRIQIVARSPEADLFGGDPNLASGQK